MNLDVAIVGGGIAGLCTAFKIVGAAPGINLKLFERGDNVGGKVRSSVLNGYTIDWGPNGFLANTKETLELVDELGLRDELAPASEAAKKRYLFFEGALHPLPMGPKEFLSSRLLLPSEKLRLLFEPLVRASHREETVFDFAARRFGRGAATTFAKPLVLGVTAGDAARTSCDALFPRLREMEIEHGSLLKGFARRRRHGQDEGPGGRLTGFERGGMQRLIDKLGEKLAPRTCVGAAVVAIERAPGGFRLTLTGGQTVFAPKVVLATPAYETARLLADIAGDAAKQLAAITYNGVRMVALAYDRIDVPNALGGFGFLAVEGEPIDCLGVLYTSSIFPGQARAGKVLLRVMMGGTRDPAIVEASEAEAIAKARRDLRIAMGIVAEPEFTYDVAWPSAIPQYEIGHRERIGRVMSELPDGLTLTGSAYGGVGINDCVQGAHTAAHRVLKNPVVA